jgi:hypothetical protein
MRALWSGMSPSSSLEVVGSMLRCSFRSGARLSSEDEDEDEDDDEDEDHEVALGANVRSIRTTGIVACTYGCGF